MHNDGSWMLLMTEESCFFFFFFLGFWVSDDFGRAHEIVLTKWDAFAFEHFLVVSYGCI